MNSNRKVFLGPNQWIGDVKFLMAACEGAECIVRFDSSAALDYRLAGLKRVGRAVRSPQVALDRASEAATRAKTLGSIDGMSIILVFAQPR